MFEYSLYFIFIQLILLVPSFYFYRWILAKKGVKAIKTFSFLCTIFIPIILTLIFISINTKYIAPWIRSEKFDSQTWKSNQKYRYRMVNDIINNELLIGKTKEEVILLLGNDTDEGPCDCIGYSTNEPDAGISIDHEVLEIDLDDKNKVTFVLINSW